MCHLVVLAFPSAINHSHRTPASIDLIKMLKKGKVFLVFIENLWSFVSASSGLLIFCGLPTSHTTFGTSECTDVCPHHPPTPLFGLESFVLFLLGPQPLHLACQLHSSL